MLSRDQVKSFHKTLNLKPSASLEQVKSAYRHLALRFHPDKNLESSAASSSVVQFRQIKEAYENLIAWHSHKKGKRIPSTSSSTSMATSKKNNADKNNNNNMNINNNNLSQVHVLTADAQWHSINVKNNQPNQEPPRHQSLPVSLEDLLKGTVKHVTILRENMGKMEEKEFYIPIKPGMQSGTKVIQLQEGDRRNQNSIPGNVVFELTEEKHPFFVRHPNQVDLIYTVNVDFYSTICYIQHATQMPTLDGQPPIVVTIEGLITSGDERRLIGMGLPHMDNVEKRGDIVLKFHINYPPHLASVEAKHQLAQSLLVDSQPPKA